MFSKNPIINLIKYSWRYSLDSRRNFVIFIVLSIIGNIIWLLQPIVIGKIFNQIQFAGKNPIRYIAISVGLLVLINILGWIFHGISRVMENTNAFLIRKNYRQDMFEKVMDLPTSWHKDHHSGDTIDKINKASERLFDFSSEFFIILQNAVGLVASIIILAMFDVRPVIIVLFTSLVAVAVIIRFDRKLLKNYQILNKAENFISSGIYDFISNYLTIISLRLKSRTVKEMESRSMKPFSTHVGNSKLNEIKWFLSSFLISLMTAGVLFLNAYNSYKASGVIVIGTLFVLYQYLSSIGEAFYTFAWKYSDTVRQNSAITSAETILDEYKKRKLENKLYLPEDWKLLEIKDLYFTYKGENDGEREEKQPIGGISLKIKRGKKIAFIGVSGSGKSTVLSLLRGLHEADKVSVYCDGKKLKSGLKNFQESSMLIPQEPEIFNNTIEYNITLGVNVDRRKIKKVMKLANLEALIARLKKGLRTNVMEKGVSLSGGEKQRLALARGLLAAEDSEFLFLDEPTSSVDIGNEREIYQNIFEAFKGKVIISSVHSLHLLRNFDYIYMFRGSQIISEGDFSAMLEDENFKALWENYNMELQEKEGWTKITQQHE